MYSILISIVVVIYSLILVDFSVLFKDLSVNADVIASTQSFYTAESVIEKALAEAGDEDPAKRVNEFLKARNDLKITDDYFSEYNLGAQAGYLNLQMGLAESDLMANEGFNVNNQVVEQGVYLASGEVLDDKTIYGLEPRSFKSFIVRDVQNENDFNKVVFDFNRNLEDSEILFEIFAFPKEGYDLNFDNFAELKGKAEDGLVKRVVINTKDLSQSGQPISFSNGISFRPTFSSGESGYKKRITITGFEPIGSDGWNYLFQFQTLDNNPVHYKLSAFRHSVAVVLPNVMQTVDVIGATTTGLYQRVKFQRETEEGILPGLNFAHFSNESIRK